MSQPPNEYKYVLQMIFDSEYESSYECMSHKASKLTTSPSFRINETFQEDSKTEAGHKYRILEVLEVLHHNLSYMSQC